MIPAATGMPCRGVFPANFWCNYGCIGFCVSQINVPAAGRPGRRRERPFPAKSRPVGAWVLPASGQVTMGTASGPNIPGGRARGRGRLPRVGNRRADVLNRGRAGRYTWTLCSPGRGPGEPVP